MTQFPRRILIVEDDTFMGSLMADALANSGFSTQLAVTAIDAKRQLETFDPDAVLVDIDLGDGPNGIDFVHVVAQTHPGTGSILLSKHVDAEGAGISAAKMPEGVSYLRKSLIHDTKALVEAINVTLRDTEQRVRHDQTDKGELALLSSVQREILRMMSLGLSNAEIAKRRNVSKSNIEQRVNEIYKAFGLAPTDELVPRVEAVRRYAAASGLPDQ